MTSEFGFQRGKDAHFKLEALQSAQLIILGCDLI